MIDRETPKERGVIHDVVDELTQLHPRKFSDFWRKTPDEQTELIERFGSPSDRTLWSCWNTQALL